MQPQSGNMIQPDGQWKFTPDNNQEPASSANNGSASSPSVAAISSQPNPSLGSAPAPSLPLASPENLQPDQSQTIQSTSNTPDEVLFQWSASEFVAYQKNSAWYMLMMIANIIIVAIIYLVTNDKISTAIIFIIGILFIAFASRKPRVLTYSIVDDGVRIGGKIYPYSGIKSFAVIDEGSLRSIVLLPTQRFMPAISMYFEPQDESNIVSALGNFLPQEDRKQDIIDRLMHKIRF